MKKFGPTQIIAVFILLGIITTLFSQRPVLAQNQEINLIQQFVWKPKWDAIVSQNNSELNVLVETNRTDRIYSRAYLPIQINITNNNSLLFNLEYATLSHVGNATFRSEVRDNLTNKILWMSTLKDTNGQLSNNTFTLPSDTLNRPVEFRFVIITNGTGQHSMDVKKAIVSFK